MQSLCRYVLARLVARIGVFRVVEGDVSSLTLSPLPTLGRDGRFHGQAHISRFNELHALKTAPNSCPPPDLLAAEGECSPSDTLPLLLWRRRTVTAGSRAVGFRAC